MTSELTFPDGLVGLPDLVRFAVHPLDGGVVELQSLDAPEFGVLAIAGELVRPGYGALLVERELAARDDEILVVLSIHGEPAAVTANLAGPIIVTADGTGRQIVVEDSDLSVRAPVGATAG